MYFLMGIYYVLLCYFIVVVIKVESHRRLRLENIVSFFKKENTMMYPPVNCTFLDYNHLMLEIGDQIELEKREFIIKGGKFCKLPKSKVLICCLLRKPQDFEFG